MHISTASGNRNVDGASVRFVLKSVGDLVTSALPLMDCFSGIDTLLPSLKLKKKI